MGKRIVEDERLYSEIIYEECKKNNVDPYFIASRIRQEQGIKGDSPLISGTYKGEEGFYNYFNIGASGDNAVKNGLKRAKEYGWSTRIKSIEGGIEWIKSNYLDKGQNTLYLQKFDVESTFYGTGYHQYMQNVQAPYEESKKMYNAYDERIYEYSFTFKIPSFK